MTSGTSTSPRHYAVIYTGSRFITAGDNGRTANSTDGLTWNYASTGDNATRINSFNYLDNQNYFEHVRSLACSNEIVVAVGGNGKVAYSKVEDDGKKWKWVANTLLGDGKTINSVCFGVGKFIVAGDSSNMKIVTATEEQIKPAENSTNGGENWHGVDSKIANGDSRGNIYTVAYSSVKGFIAGGDNGRMSESPNGTDWSLIGSGQHTFGDREKISCILWANGKFFAGGNAYSDDGNLSKLTYSE
jgi:hypothetical protein